MSLIQNMRISYEQDALLESNCPQEPFGLFSKWFDEARTLIPSDQEPNALCLSTATKDGRPSSRIVLLKSFDHLQGFQFYTNYDSRKGKELIDNPHASMVFWWGQRSVRIEGRVEKLSESVSTAYFQSRPRGSQIGAWTSPQSQILPDREALEQREKDFVKQFEGVDPIPKPPHWGGFALRPLRIEFWQGRPSRLHDRIEYLRDDVEVEKWVRSRLAP
jgi:pyridoxamine 5'-phosphate oxidase